MAGKPYPVQKYAHAPAPAAGNMSYAQPPYNPAAYPPQQGAYPPQQGAYPPQQPPGYPPQPQQGGGAYPPGAGPPPPYYPSDPYANQRPGHPPAHAPYPTQVTGAPAAYPTQVTGAPAPYPNQVTGAPGRSPYPPQVVGYPTQQHAAYQQGGMMVSGSFDSSARFGAGSTHNIPPPPPGVMPNAAQVASMHGQSVHMNQKPAGFFSGHGSGGWSGI